MNFQKNVQRLFEMARTEMLCHHYRVIVHFSEDGENWEGPRSQRQGQRQRKIQRQRQRQWQRQRQGKRKIQRQRQRQRPKNTRSALSVSDCIPNVHFCIFFSIVHLFPTDGGATEDNQLCLFLSTLHSRVRWTYLEKVQIRKLLGEICFNVIFWVLCGLSIALGSV